MDGRITKEKDSIPDRPISIKKLIERKEGSVKPRKRSSESYNERMSHSPNQPSLQHGATNDRYTNMSTMSTILSVINDDAYEFNRRKMGYAILIINSEFDHQNARPTADIDGTNMSALFRKLGFDIELLKNNTYTELKENLAVIRNSIGRDHDCLACIISSHGAEIPLSRQLNQDQKLRQHVIYTKDAFLPTEEILQEFDDDHCKNLAGKPKMFFIQACRCAVGCDEKFDVDPGFDVMLSTDSNKNPPRHHANTGSENKDGVSTRHNKEMTETCVTPCHEDFLVMFVCLSGRVGCGSDAKGGWLMYCLHEVFKTLLDTNYKMDLPHILSQVCGKMARDLETYCPQKKIYHRTKSAAVVYHMLTKSLYLKPKFYRMVDEIVPLKDTSV